MIDNNPLARPNPNRTARLQPLIPKPKPSMLKGAARLVLPSAGSAAVSILLGQEDLKARELAVEQDPSFINQAQLGLARAEMGADLAGAIPNPVTPIAETVGFTSGAANLIIDIARSSVTPRQIRGRSGAKRALEDSK